jgi:hypothetical protein
LEVYFDFTTGKTRCGDPLLFVSVRALYYYIALERLDFETVVLNLLKGETEFE